jgi:hypothetical protein
VGGLTAARYQAIGPRVTLSEPTVISEIGAIAFSPLALMVQIRRSSNGVPDPSGVIASYFLSHRQPAAFRYESVSPNLLLPAGTYFVLFVSQPNFYTDSGGLEGALAQTRGAQRATSFAAGSLNTVTGESRFSETETGAVRVLGCKLPGATALQGSSGLSGYQVITGAPVAIVKQASASASATCPNGKSVIGGGFRTEVPDGSSASPTLLNVYSSNVSGTSAWSVSGFNGSTGKPNQNKNLNLAAYAICAFVL